MDESANPNSTASAEASAVVTAADGGPGFVDREVAAEVIEAFVRVRDEHRGQLAAPMSALLFAPDQIAAAIVALRQHSGLVRQRALEEAMFDLAAFTDDAEAALINTFDPPKRRRDYPRPYNEAVKRIQAQRRHLMNAWHGVSRYDIFAFQDPVPIGDSRRSLDESRDAGYSQGTGILGTFILVGLTVLAAVLGKAWYLVLAVGILVQMAAFLLFTDLAGRVERAWRRRDPSDAAEERRARMHENVVFVGSLLVPPVILLVLFFR